MNVDLIKLQLQADAYYRKGNIAEAIKLTEQAVAVASSDSDKRDLQERIGEWKKDLKKQRPTG